MARIVLNTFGSLGDLHPYLALALGLKQRGHSVSLATAELYRAKIEAEGIEFAPVRPDVGELAEQPEFVKRLWDARRGTEYLIRDYLLPQVEAGFEDLREACRGADLVLTHAAAYAGPIAAEYLRIRWLSVALQPAVFFSALDPSVVAAAPHLRHLYWLGPGLFRLLLGIAERTINGWIGPILDLRKRLGLPAPQLNPVTRGQFSPDGTLALFSAKFARPAADWPPNTEQTGFLFYDQLGVGFEGRGFLQNKVPTNLESFLQAGKAPLLFTLGSSAVMESGSFFQESLRAVERLGERAILLVGRGEQHGLPAKLSGAVLVADYLPYSEVMPRVSAIVHQGGIGTTAQSLRAGRPMLVVPWAHDQPDNAERVRKLGVGRWMRRDRYTADRLARELRQLLGQPKYSEKACRVGNAIQSEDGLTAACDAVERALSPALTRM